MLETSHNIWFLLAAAAVALMAGFTGLTLTRGAAGRPSGARKLVVVMAAVALGGGVWSMHFVAMLGLGLPVPYHYDALVTLISALVAILTLGLSLLCLHVLALGRAGIVVSGAIMGLGIVLMHFIGMAGMELCRPVNGPADYLLTAAAAIGLSVAAIRVSYPAETLREIAIGSLGFGTAVVAVHCLAIAQTGFVQVAEGAALGPALGNESLAMLVTLAAFLICGAFLLTGVTFLEPGEVASPKAAPEPVMPAAAPMPLDAGEGEAAIGVPFERDGRILFAPREKITAIRAEGRYSLLHVGAERLFCPWSITEAETRLAGAGFLRVHRSYLVNPAHVAGFERRKDTSVLYFESTPSIERVPVARSRLGAVREALGI